MANIRNYIPFMSIHDLCLEMDLQVIIMVEEYLSFPTITLYAIEDVEKLPSPAFTICPKPSVSSSFEIAWNPQQNRWLGMKDAISLEQFKNISVSFRDVVLNHDEVFSDYSTISKETGMENSSRNGETIHVLRESQ